MLASKLESVLVTLVGSTLHRFIRRITGVEAEACSFGAAHVIMLGAPSSDLHFGGAVWIWAHPFCNVLEAESVRRDAHTPLMVREI